MDWKYAVRTPTAIITLAESLEEAKKAVKILKSEYGLSELEIIEYPEKLSNEISK